MIEDKTVLQPPSNHPLLHLLLQPEAFLATHPHGNRKELFALWVSFIKHQTITPFVVTILISAVVLSIGHQFGWVHTFREMVRGALWGMAFGMTVGVVISLVSVALGRVRGVMAGIAFSVVGCVTFGVVFSVLASVSGIVVESTLGNLILGSATGMAFGIPIGVACGMGTRVAQSLVAGLVITVTLGVLGWLATSVELGATIGTAAALSFLLLYCGVKRVKKVGSEKSEERDN